MCEITVTNLHDPKLNERLWLLMGSLGSKEKHDDGWGVANQNGEMFKCAVPMHWTTNAGTRITPVSKGASMLLGHIRDASPKVPVNEENSHPFQLADITFVHNGKLTPKDDKNFVMEQEVPDIDPQTQKQRVDKNGVLQTKTVSRSDSLIFFEEFVRDWEAESGEFLTQDEKFTKVVNTTMSKFYGKFALVFIINGTFYICRGKTADLHICYWLKEYNKDSEVLGWAINTGRMSLDVGTVLLSNLNVLDGGQPLHFTYPDLLKEETIFVADALDVREIGVLKENIAPVKTYNSTATHGGAATNKTTNFTQNGGGVKTTTTIDELTKETELIVKWMEANSMSPQDIQIMLYAAFRASTLDVTVDMLKAFYRNVLVKLSNKTDRKIRKAVRRTNIGYIGIYDYNDLLYPWMLNPKNVQKKFIK